MVTTHRKEYSSGTYGYDLSQLGEVEMRKFDKTFNFVLGIQNSDIDFDIS
jgi:hypothetical protein